MKFLKIGLLFAATGLFVFACGQTDRANNAGGAANNQTAVVTNASPAAEAAPPTPAATAADEFAEVRTIYLETCVKCHKEGGTGGEATFENKKIKVPSFKSPGAIKMSDDRLYDHIANGEEGEMPAFKDRLSEQQMRTLVKFIRKEFQGQ